MILLLTVFFYLLLYLFQLTETNRYLVRQVTGPRTSAAESLDTQAAIAQTPSYAPLGPPVFRDELLSNGVPSDSEQDFLNLFSDNATTHLATGNGQCWGDSQDQQKSSLISSSVASPVPPAAVTVSNSSASRGAANKRSRGGGVTSGEPTKPAKASRVPRPKKSSVPVAATNPQITGQYFNNCEQSQQQAPPRVGNPPLTGGIQL